MQNLSPTVGTVRNGWLVYQQQGQKVVVLLDTPAWYAWLETATTFTFTGEEGTFTAHKACAGNRRGGWYWRAYRRKRGRLFRCYLGISSKVTLSKLRKVACRLATDTESAGSGKAGADAPPVSHDPSRDLTSVPGLTSTVILQTNITPPRLPAQHVARPRLLALLEQGLRGPLTLVSAPAGSGKTTLLSAWAANTTRPVAWLSCEEGDNDPARFLSSLSAALARLDEHLGAAVETDRPWHPDEHERVLSRLLNDLERLLPDEAVLILDDVHQLTTEASQTVLMFLLSHLPSSLHVLIGTRGDLPGLSRWRARNQVSELRSQELLFASAEVEAFVHKIGLPLDSESIGLLEERTEGWIAGIQLVTLALRGHADAALALRTMGLTPRFLRDYVREEILLRQPPEMQRFLLRTSVLERLTGPLCESVTGESGGQRKLATLLQDNLFVSALDDTDTWYRYHPLFAETLRTLLQQQEGGTLVPELYRRASRWYEQHGWGEDACDYALLAGDLPHAARLLEELVPSLVEQGKLVRLSQWLDRLPQKLIAASVYLSLAVIWTRPLRTSEPLDPEQVIERLTELLAAQAQDDSASQAALQRELTLYQAAQALAQGDIPQALSRAAEVTRLLHGPETAWSRFTLWRQQVLLGAAYRARGDLQASEQMWRNTYAAGGTLPNTLALFRLDDLYEEQGRLRELGRLYEDVLRSCREHRDPPLTLLVWVHWRHGVLLCEWNRLEEAQVSAQQLLKLAPLLDRSSPPELAFFGLRIQAHVALAQGNGEWVRQLLERSEFDVARFPIPQARKDVLILVPVRLALACGQLESALRWVSTCGLRYDDPLATPLEKQHYVRYVTLARVLIARGRGHRNTSSLAQARMLLDRLLEITIGAGAEGRRIEVQMLLALALYAQGKTKQALSTLGPMLAQAEPEGYLRLFADEGEAMAQMLTLIGPCTSASPHYLQRIQAAIAPVWHAQPETSTRVAPRLLPIAPLSEREGDVLHLLAEGLSNQQIAEHLVLSLNTVKLHVKHILAKLGATNRTQAVARARAFHLLTHEEVMTLSE